MPKYVIVENPPPFTQGAATTSSITNDLNTQQIFQQNFSNRLVNIPTYNIIQKSPIKSTNTVINTIVLNETQINTSAVTKLIHSSIIEDISVRTQLINDTNGGEFIDENVPTIWSLSENKINCIEFEAGDILEIILKFNCTSDTLGGIFKVEAEGALVLDVIEESISHQGQKYNIAFKILINEDCLLNGIKFFITPELGMIISVNEVTILIQQQ